MQTTGAAVRDREGTETTVWRHRQHKTGQFLSVYLNCRVAGFYCRCTMCTVCVLSWFSVQAAMFTRTKDTFRSLDIVCNNAGVLDERDWKESHKLLLINLVCYSTWILFSVYPQFFYTVVSMQWYWAPWQQSNTCQSREEAREVWSLMCHLWLVSLCTQHSTIMMMMRHVVLYCTGLYPISEGPVYSAAKSGIISYTRAMRVSWRLAYICNTFLHITYKHVSFILA